MTALDHSVSARQGPDEPTTPSPTFERILAAGDLGRRARQDRAVTLAHQAVTARKRVIIQAPTGVGKSFVALATAADAGQPGAPGIVVTTTNALGDQYLRDCREAADLAGFTYTRVMGASHYICADSDGARAEGVLAADDIDSEQEEAARQARNQWLEEQVPARVDAATRYELRTAGLGHEYACPGYPECSGNALGGCGSKKARARGFAVQVVISNFHLLAYTQKTGLPLLPLTDAAVVVIDEAHELPGTIAEIDGGTINDRTGSRVFANHPRLAAAANRMIVDSLNRVSWPERSSEWDTEAPVPVDMDAVTAFANEYTSLTPEIRAHIDHNTSQEPGQFGAGDVMSLLRAWVQAASGQSGWRTWTDRALIDRRTATWKPSGDIHLRRVDAAAQIVPTMLPAAAVLLTGTVGDSLPARCGLTDADVHDLGQEFDWSKVRGRISQHSGVKSGIPFEQIKVRDQERLQELADAIQGHRGALVLANAARDARLIAGQLDRLLPRHVVFTPQGGGSLAAEQVKRAFIEHRDRGGWGVLVGVDSFATGLDLPGELCTFVAWWVCVRSASGFYDQQVSVHFSGHGSYLDERFRSKFAQGIGRLLRSHTDEGEVMVCDARAAQHLNRRLTRVDQHLADITWAWAGGVG